MLRAVRSPADVAVVKVGQREEVERRLVRDVQLERRHVRVDRARAVARRAVHEHVVEPAVVVEILPPDAQVEEAVEEPRPLDEEVVENQLVRERVRVPIGLRTPAELVREARVDAPAHTVGRRAGQFAPDARPHAQMLGEGAAHAGEENAAAGQPRHVLHDLLADAEVGPRIKGDVAPGRDGQEGDAHADDPSHGSP